MAISSISNFSYIGVKAFKPLKKVINPSTLKYVPIKEEPKLTEKIIEKSLKHSKGLSFDHILENIELANGQYSSRVFEFTKKLEKTEMYDHEIIEVLKNVAKTDITKFDENAFGLLVKKIRTLSSSLSLSPKMGIEVLTQSIGKNGEFSEKDLKNILAIFDKYEKPKDSFSAFKFRKYTQFKNIDELSLSQKNDFLTKLISNGPNEKVAQDIPILPKTKDEYTKLIQKLLDDTSLKIKPLAKSEQQKTISAFKNLFDKKGEIVESELDKITKAFPEILQKKTISKSSLKMLQKINKDERFIELSPENKLIVQLAVLFKNSSRIQGIHNIEQSAFNAYYLAEKLNLPHENKLKLYSIVKNQNLLENAVNGEISKNALINATCELRYKDNYKMLEIFSDAKNMTTPQNQKTLNLIKNTIKKEIQFIQSQSIQIPQSKVPKASQFIVNGTSVKKVKSNGVTNIVVYLDKKAPIKYIDENGTEKVLNPNDVHNFYHATTQLEGVEFASRPNSKYALSSSYTSPVAKSHHLFGTEGVIVNLNSDDIRYAHAFRDADGTGFGKEISPRAFRLRNIGKAFLNLSNIFKKYNCKSLEELRAINPQAAKELKTAILDASPATEYGEAIGVFAQPQGLFFQGPKKGFNPMYSRIFSEKTKIQTLKAKLYKLIGYKEKYKFKEVPQNIKTYAAEKDFAIFHLGN